ncbi:MAG TPA: hypothetical protein VEA44_16115 [Caulobacter sp.]|nr:hypothetical protein [Caulobacter sp.]
MTRVRKKPPPAYLPIRAVENWNALLDELRRCLRDDGRPRTRFNDLFNAVQARDCAWPSESESDQWLLGGFLRLVMAFATAGPTRRPWLGAQLAVLVDAVEGQLDHFTSDDDARKVIPTTVPPVAPPPPQEGERGYRRDIDG